MALILNHEADPVKEENMLEVKRLLKETDAQVGIGLDGDADRMAAMTKKGFLVPGDQLLALLANKFLKKIRVARLSLTLKAHQVFRN